MSAPLHNQNSETELAIRDALKNVVDPELGVNIIDLGLVYKIVHTDAGNANVEYTLSSRGCPMGEIIRESMDTVLRQKFPGLSVRLSLVWDPAWSPAFITPKGREALGLIS